MAYPSTQIIGFLDKGMTGHTFQTLGGFAQISGMIGLKTGSDC